MAIKAIYTELTPDGRPRFGLSPADHEKIRQGYGCPNCLEDFTEWGANGVVVAFGKCPVCKHTMNPETDFEETPGYWLPDPTDPFYAA